MPLDGPKARPQTRRRTPRPTAANARQSTTDRIKRSRAYFAARWNGRVRRPSSKIILPPVPSKERGAAHISPQDREAGQRACQRQSVNRPMCRNVLSRLHDGLTLAFVIADGTHMSYGSYESYWSDESHDRYGPRRPMRARTIECMPSSRRTSSTSANPAACKASRMSVRE